MHNAQIFPGFYGVTYYIGFRDDFDVRVSIIFLFSFLLWSENIV